MDSSYKNILISIVIALLGYFGAGYIFDEIQARLIGVVIFLVAMWTNEALPLGVVSLFPIILFPAFDILTTNATTANYSKSIIFLFLGGFQVGCGARYAGGCTSGHAIVGLSNLEKPSLIAVIGFFIGGLVMTWVLIPLIF